MDRSWCFIHLEGWYCFDVDGKRDVGNISLVWRGPNNGNLNVAQGLENAP